MASCIGWSPSVPGTSSQPYSRATYSLSERVSASWISMSGFGPGVTFRNTFIRASSPKRTEELLCSPENNEECASRSSSTSSSRWKTISSDSLCRAKAVSHCCNA
jgi:hypothetical protein